MALSAATNWDVRTGGSDSNGGGFVVGAAGTDYSQSNSPGFSGTDLTSVSSLVVSSASHNFVSTDVGNIVQITSSTSGFTTGFYQIVSVSANQATFDRSPGTVGVGGVWAEGGSLLTPGKALGAAVAQNAIYFKAGTYALTSVVTLPAIDNLIVEGYSATHGDLGTRPLITTSTNSTKLFQASGTFHGLIFWNINFSNTAGTPADGFIASTGGVVGSLTFNNCNFTGFVAAVRGDFNGDYYFSLLTLKQCTISSCSGTGAIWHDGATNLESCLFSGNTHASFYVDSNQTTTACHNVSDCTFYQGVNAIFFNLTSTLSGVNIKNSNFDSQTGDAVKFTSSTSILANCSNSIFVSAGGWAANWSSTTGAGFWDTNFFYNNTSGTLTNFAGVNTNPINLSGYPWTLAGSNYAPNSTAGAGAAVKAAGFNGVTPAGTGYADGGALQSQGSGGGGSTVYVIAPTINNIIQEV